MNSSDYCVGIQQSGVGDTETSFSPSLKIDWLARRQR